jgi:hypothetical protein
MKRERVNSPGLFKVQSLRQIGASREESQDCVAVTWVRVGDLPNTNQPRSLDGTTCYCGFSAMAQRFGELAITARSLL